MTKLRLATPPNASPNWAYFLDFDGTLIEFAKSPKDVVVDRALRELIARMLLVSGGALAVVSGRLISDLQNLFGCSCPALGGLHGLERRDGSGNIWRYAATSAPVHAAKATLAPLLERHPGLLFEDKGVSFALHYRLVPGLAHVVIKMMEQLLVSCGPGMELQRGKFVLELKPAGHDKGTAVCQFMKEPHFAGRRSVFIGDDLNDEPGFAEVNRRNGISIKVGPGASCARYRLNDVSEVRQWLGGALRQ